MDLTTSLCCAEQGCLFVTGETFWPTWNCDLSLRLCLTKNRDENVDVTRKYFTWVHSLNDELQ